MTGVSEIAASGVRLRGLVVDWGGVLTASLDGAMAAWVQHDAIDYDHFRDVMRSWASRPPGLGATLEGTAGGLDPAAVDAPDHAGDDDGPVADLEQAADEGPAGASPVHRLERGEMSGEDFERTLAVELELRGSAVPAEGLLARMLSGLQSLDDDMIGLVRRVRERGIRTALLSNSWGDHYPDQLWDGLFDVVVISGRVGMRKPEPEIFRYACSELGLATAECVMVDDLPHNVSGAVSVGMVAVHHRSYADTAAELEILFEVPLR